MNFLSKPPRELKGADTSGKYDYQKDISICLLLESHLKETDYLLVFDYHDDLVILNSETSPTKYHFFQIKGHDDGKYKLSQILATKKTKTGKSNSILGKLYSHIIDFDEATGSVNFLTNREFDIPFGDKEEDNCKNYTEICIKDISEASLKTLNKKLLEEFGIMTLDPRFQKITFLKVESLSVKDSSGHAKGKLVEFLQTKYPGIKTNADLIYQNIFDEVKRKSRHDKILNSFEELSQKKGIGKTYFTEMLNVIGATKDYEEVWKQVSNTLSSEGVKAGDILHYKSVWKTLEITRMNPTDMVVKDAIKITKEVIEANPSNFRNKTLLEITDEIKPKLSRFKHALSDDLLTVIIFSGIYD